jgi:hypothetical protein
MVRLRDGTLTLLDLTTPGYVELDVTPGEVLATKVELAEAVIAGGGTGEASAAQAKAASDTGTRLSPRRFKDAAWWFDVRWYGAVGDGTADDTAAVQAALDAAAAAGPFDGSYTGVTVYFPAGAYKITDTLEVTGSTPLVGASGLTSIYFVGMNAAGTNEWGIHVQGTYGGSAVDFIQIRNLRLQGQARGLLKLTGVSGFKIENVFVQNAPDATALWLEECQDFEVSHVDILNDCGDDSLADGTGAVLYVNTCNNGYFNYWRNENPEAVGAWIEDSNTITFHEGKFDSGGATPANEPNVVSLNSFNVQFDRFNFNGADGPAAQVQGWGEIRLEGCRFTNCKTNGLVKATATTQEIYPTGYQPGYKRRPKIELYGCTIMAQAFNNDVDHSTALVHAVAPEPNYYPHSSTTPMRVSAKNTSGGYVYVILQHWNGSAYVNAPVNDRYIGAYLVHMQTGYRTRINANFSDGSTYTDTLAADTANLPVADAYKVEYAEKDGVAVNQRDNEVAIRKYAELPATFDTIAYIGAVTVNSSAYSTFVTTVTLSAAASSTWVGMYLYKPATGTSWLIRGTSGSTVLLDFDVAAAVTAGTYWVRAGKETLAANPLLSFD